MAKRSWIKRHHETVSALATTASAVVAIIAIGFSGIAVWLQFSQNAVVQDQLDQQSRQAEEQAEQFLRVRSTDLARIVFDPIAHASLRTYAVRELISSDSRAFRKTGYEEDAAKANWTEAAQQDSHQTQLAAFLDVSIWRCEKYWDTGGGSGNTERRVLNLRNANLADTDLSHLNISCVDFSGSDLTGANLSKTTLSNVLLNNVRMKGARLRGASIFWTVINPSESEETDREVAAQIGNAFGMFVAIPCSVGDLIPHYESSNFGCW